MLKNFGFGVNAATIRIARENRTIAIQNFVQFVMSTISSVANAYYELVYAIENHKSAVETRELARELLDQNRIQERVGTMSPLDVIQAEAGVAESEQSVITTARAIKDNENTLKRLICQQVSEFGGVSLVPVDYPAVEMIALDVAESTRRALETRADYQSAIHALESQNITVQFNRNQLWPEVNLTGTYNLNGLGHNFDSFSDNLSSTRSPYWNVGVVVSVPLGNRQARANYHIGEVGRRSGVAQPQVPRTKHRRGGGRRRRSCGNQSEERRSRACRHASGPGIAGRGKEETAWRAPPRRFSCCRRRRNWPRSAPHRSARKPITTSRSWHWTWRKAPFWRRTTSCSTRSI